MKKRSFILVVFLLLASLFCLTACQGEAGKNGEKGPVGPQGDQGKPGTPGTNGENGLPGLDGADGEDASNAVIGIDDNSIVWKNEDETNWKPVISFDDLFSYTRTYTITLNANGGTLTSSEMKDLIYKETYKIDLKPTMVDNTETTDINEAYEFYGWADEDGTIVEENTIKVVRDYTLTAVWQSTVFFDGTDDAKGKSFVETEGKTTAEIVAALKEKFITDYCEALKYDATKKTTLLAASTEDLYKEFWANATCSGKALYTVANGSVTTTPLYDKYDFMFNFLLNRFNVPSNYKADTNPVVRKGYFDARSVAASKMLHDKDVAALGSYSSELGTTNASYTAKLIANGLANFLNSTANLYAGTSDDKLIPFTSNLLMGDTSGNKLFEEDGVTTIPYDPYDGLATILEVKVVTMVELVADDTFKLPELTKDGFDFLGWFDGETKVTEVSKNHNEKTITAKWQAKAAN